MITSQLFINMHLCSGKCKILPQRNVELLVLSLIFLLSFVIKTYRIEKGNYVVWDESHFGKFSASYLKREFYFDVHPPLGKLMTALSGLISNQDPEFRFESGDEYPSGVDYCSMRRFHAFISAFIPLFIYGTMRELGYDVWWCSMCSLFYIFENGMVSISRLILLDSHLLTFTVCVLYTFVRFAKRRRCSESLNLALLGVFIGLVLSVKWIGCFTTLFVGIYVIDELYKSVKRDSVRVFAAKFARRALFLILVPVLVYIFWFLLHFAILVNGSSDEAQMSSLFHLRLKGNSPKRLNKYVEYGFMVTLKASKMTGGNMHSHNHPYPGLTENQVTTYHHKDENDEWAFQKVTNGEEAVDFVRDGDTVVLVHGTTRMYLGAGGKPALLSRGILVGTTPDLRSTSTWRVEIVSDIIKHENRLRSITSKFRLFNLDGKCYLASTSKSYPDWGFGQGEVVCTPERSEESLWNVEKNGAVSSRNPEYLEVLKIRNTFFLHFWELNRAMLKVNSSFTQDEDLEPPRIVSKPYEWFILRRGLRMVHWDNEDRDKFYMFGNPFIWYLSNLCVLLCPLILLSKVVRLKRSGSETSILADEFFEVFVCFVGWLCHYLPFFFIGRVLYFHHYFPAMIFAILSVSYVVRHAKKAMPVLLVCSLACFFIFSPLTYGFKDPSRISYAKIVRTWDFV